MRWEVILGALIMAAGAGVAGKAWIDPGGGLAGFALGMALSAFLLSLGLVVVGVLW